MEEEEDPIFPHSEPPWNSMSDERQIPSFLTYKKILKIFKKN